MVPARSPDHTLINALLRVDGYEQIVSLPTQQEYNHFVFFHLG